jgi:hypothetical protein
LVELQNLCCLVQLLLRDFEGIECCFFWCHSFAPYVGNFWPADARKWYAGAWVGTRMFDNVFGWQITSP